MKKILTLCTALFILASCSNSDNDNAATVTGSNFTATQTQYDDLSGGAIENISTLKYVNGRPDIFTFYDAQHVMQLYLTYEYTGDKLSKIVQHYPSPNTETVSMEYFYDSQGRIYKIDSGGGGGATFTYNSDGSITGARTGFEGYTETKSWLVNSSGLIYKEIDADGSFYELAFNGTNTISGTFSGGDVKTFEYDTAHDLSQMGYAPVYGDYKPNTVLQSFYLEDEETAFAANYLTKEFINGVLSSQNILEFDTRGRLATSTRRTNGGAITSVITYAFE